MKAISQETQENIIPMIRDGHGCVSVAKHVGVSLTTVEKYSKKLGLINGRRPSAELARYKS